MTEPKSALKVRWSPKEVELLVEVWAKVCTAPAAGRLKRELLNKIIFDGYNTRCARARETRRSPTAVNTQRVRMTQFARFVTAFDREELPNGGRSWFDLSTEEQLEIEMPIEWRRQVTTFSRELFSTFKRCILPVEDAQSAAKRDKNKKPACKQRSRAKQEEIPQTDHQPCWSMQDKVTLTGRWGELMKTDKLTLKDFELLTYDLSCERLALPGRSAFSAWRKARTLVSSWQFICKFNRKHQPGWFELAEGERDLLIMWGDLPNNFEDIEQQVFDAMEGAAPVSAVQVKEEVLPMEIAPLSPKRFSPTIALEPTPLPYLCKKETRSESTETEATLDSLLFEDDAETEAVPDAKRICLVEINNGLASGSCVADANLHGGTSINEQETGTYQLLEPKQIIATKTLVTPLEARKLHRPQEIGIYQPLEPKPVNGTGRADETLEEMLQTHKNQVQCSLRKLQETLERETEHTQEWIRAARSDQPMNDPMRSSKFTKLVLAQQNSQLMSTLRLVEESCTRNGSEVRALVQELLSSQRDPIRNETTGLDGL